MMVILIESEVVKAEIRSSLREMQTIYGDVRSQNMKKERCYWK